jgi:catechol 2,3-dioxygenase-like lactoylglutathione lyase family enzyme
MYNTKGPSSRLPTQQGIIAMPLAHITLAVRDVRRASRFFAAVLGWRPLDRPNNIALPAAWLEIAPGQELHLVEVADYAPSPFEREYGRHIAVAYPRDSFAGLKERLQQHGARLVAPLRETAFERFFFTDPEGYVFEVVDADR